MPEYIVSVPSGSRTETELQGLVRGRANVTLEAKADLFDRIQRERTRDRLFTEARDHALRDVARRLESVLREVQDRNYGLAERDLEHVVKLMDDEHGSPIIVQDAVNLMAPRFEALDS